MKLQTPQEELPIPEEVLTWLAEQPVQDLGENVDSILTLFDKSLKSDIFLTEEEISEISTKQVETEFKKGNYKKMFSKKMRARINGKVLLKHMPLRKTAVFTELVATDKKQVGYNFTVANYFDSPGGPIYVLRHGVPFPSLFVFPGHFFDRLLQRGFKTTDHAARMQAVFRIMRFLDRAASETGLALFRCHKTNRIYLSAFGGLCLGAGVDYSILPERFGYNTKNFRHLPTHLAAPPDRRHVHFFLTYVSKEQLGPEQLCLYNTLRSAIED